MADLDAQIQSLCDTWGTFAQTACAEATARFEHLQGLLGMGTLAESHDMAQGDILVWCAERWAEWGSRNVIRELRCACQGINRYHVYATTADFLMPEQLVDIVISYILDPVEIAHPEFEATCRQRYAQDFMLQDRCFYHLVIEQNT